MENIAVRALRTEDIDSIVSIYSAIVKKPVDPAFRQSILHHAQKHDGGCCVAERNGKVVGFLISYTLVLGFGLETSAWIAILGVDPTFMGMGIGDKMVDETFAYYKAKGINLIYSTVQWDTSDLLSFFKTQGFEKSNHINLKKDL